jgi:mRNA-degrading endonuclease RelE of RelBE toxin-antitoxin system
VKPIRIVYALSAGKFLRHLHPDLKAVIRSAIDELRLMPLHGKSLHGEFSGLRSLRYKKYRVIYRYLEKTQTIEIVFAGARKNIYTDLAKLMKGLID